MSDYFSPYIPPGGGFDPYLPPGGWPQSTHADRAARRASFIMFILSALAMACSAMFFMLWMMPQDQFPPDELKRMQDAAAQAGLSLKELFLGGGLMVMIPGLVMGVLGMWVRTGRIGAIVTAMIINGLLLLLMGLSTLQALFAGQSAGGALIVAMGIVALMVWLMLRLTAAARASRLANSTAAQIQAQYWQQPFDPEGGYAPPPPIQPPTESK